MINTTHEMKLVIDELKLPENQYHYIMTCDDESETESYDIAQSYFLHSKGSGTGKTYKALAVLKKWLRTHTGRFYGKNEFGIDQTLKDSYYVKIIHQNHLSKLARDMKSFDKEEVKLAEMKLKEIKEANFLLIDDLWTASTSAYDKSNEGQLMFQILDYRSESTMSNEQVTFITSNNTLSDIKEYYIEKNFSRMFGMCKLVNFKGEDIRLKKTKTIQRYVEPTEPEKEKKEFKSFPPYQDLIQKFRANK